MTKRFLSLAWLACLAVSVTAAESVVLQNVSHRSTLLLNGRWNYIVDPYETGYYDYRYQPHDQQANPNRDAFFTDSKPKDKTDRVEYDFDKSPVLRVPGDWNSQKENLFYYEGTVWYKRAFDYTKKKPDNRVFVHFGAANYRADVYLNGKKLGFHKGGFTPFAFEVTKLLRETNNFLIVKVDNKRKAEEVPTLNTDWWNYGGITRDVQLVETPATFVGDYFLQLKKGSQNTLAGWLQLNGEKKVNRTVTLAIPDLGIQKQFLTDEQGAAQFEFAAENLKLWSPDNPQLYQVTLSTEDEQLADRIGFRCIETKGSDILLNGRSIFLRGICIHEENALRGGRAYSREDAAMVLNWAKELGCNFVRLAHYPHNEHIIRLADEMGIMVWEENPVYWTIQWTNAQTLATARAQLTEEIARDKNRAAVIIWSMANETPVSEPRLAFLKSLAETARQLDSTRLISAALEIHSKKGNDLVKTMDDPFAASVDVLSFNEYVGWYDGLPDKCAKVQWDIPFNKPVMISECGGGALGGYHADQLTRWSEEFQKDLFEQNLKMLSHIPQWRGVTPWILVDFRSPKRLLPGIQDGWNRKGLISETGARKQAFSVLQQFYGDVKKKYE